MLYIDTSVLVAYYSPEPLSEQIERTLRSTSDLGISDLTEVELCSAVARKVRERELERRDAMKILAQFHAHLDARQYVRFSLSNEHSRVAKHWVSQMEWPLRTLDALHLAVASVAQATIITTDVQLARCAESMGLSFQLFSGNASR